MIGVASPIDHGSLANFRATAPYVTIDDELKTRLELA
jgi:hypothetical protein